MPTSLFKQDPSPAQLFYKDVSWALALIARHKLVLASVGFLTIIIHFWRIRFLPELALVDLGLIAGAIVLFSVMAALVLLCVFFMPGFYLQGLTQQRFLPRPRGRRSRRSALRIAHPSGTADKEDPSTIHPARKRRAYNPDRDFNSALALVITCTYLGFGLAWLGYSVIIKFFNDHVAQIGFAFMIVAMAGIFYGILTRVPQTGPQRFRRMKWRWLKYTALSSCLYLLLLPFAALATGTLLPSLTNASEMNEMVVLALLPVIHSTIYATQRQAASVRVGWLISSGAMLLLATGSFFEANDLGAANFRIGMLKNQSIIVDREGCNLIEAARIEGISCNVSDGAANTFHVVEHVQLLTRLGAHVVVASSEWKVTKPSRSLPLPSGHVKSWFEAEVLPTKE